MRAAIVLCIVAGGGLGFAQDGQHGSKPGWPCTAGRAVDPSYLKVSESTGGQLFLFQKNEAAQSGVIMSASYTHPATVLRAVGHLSGTRDFDFPVDSSIESILVLVSLQCRNAIQITRPGGSELTQANSALSVDLQAGRILRVDQPESGQWRLRIAGTGLFVLSVLAKTNTGIGHVAFSDENRALTAPLLGVPQNLAVRLSGQVSQVKLQLVGAGSGRITDLGEAEPDSHGAYRTTVVPSVERFRVLITGTDSGAWPFQRIHPVLFRARPPK
jgi:hypothetical protein